MAKVKSQIVHFKYQISNGKGQIRFVKRSLISVLFILIVLLLSSQVVSAQETSKTQISVSPTIFNILLSPGKTYQYSIEIQNLSSQPIPAYAVMEPIFSPDDANPKQNYAQSLVPWITISNPNLLIPPKEIKKLIFSINVPEKIALGGYYGMIYLSPFTKEITSSTEILTRIGILLLSSVGVQEIPLNKIEVNNLKTSRLVYDNEKPTLLFSVKNMALNHFSAKPFIRLKPLIGSESYSDLEEKFVFPGKSRSWQHTITQSLPWNIYRGTLFVSVGNGIQKTDTFVFVNFPYRILLVVVFGMMIIMIMKKRGKKIMHALRILIKG